MYNRIILELPNIDGDNNLIDVSITSTRVVLIPDVGATDYE